jgi:hypothetical protein
MLSFAAKIAVGGSARSSSCGAAEPTPPKFPQPEDQP